MVWSHGCLILKGSVSDSLAFLRHHGVQLTRDVPSEWFEGNDEGAYLLVELEVMVLPLETLPEFLILHIRCVVSQE